VIAVQADVSQADQVRDMFANTIGRFGRIDIIVASAGIEVIEIPFVDYTQDQCERVFDINTKGAFFRMQQAQSMRASIIVISSNTTRLSLPGFAVYDASNLAPTYFVEVLAKELGPRGVTVNSVAPGATTSAGVFTGVAVSDSTARSLTEMTPLRRLATPDDVARVVAFVAAADAGFITGHHFVVDGGTAIQ
jgi:3-oxoacyl-[acyl-carrier protein] reductase